MAQVLASRSKQVAKKCKEICVSVQPGPGTRRACIVAVMNPAGVPSESKPTLLIVDDDQELCAMLAEYLVPEGFLTLTACTGPAGLEQLGRAAVALRM